MIMPQHRQHNTAATLLQQGRSAVILVGGRVGEAHVVWEESVFVTVVRDMVLQKGQLMCAGTSPRRSRGVTAILTWDGL